MITSLSYFPSRCAKNSTPVMAALLDSARRSGIQIQQDSLDSDAALIWSVLWSGRMSGNRAVYEHYRMTGRPVIVAEIGCLQRGKTWKVSVNHVTNQGHYGHTHDLDPDRPRRLGLSLGQGCSSPEILIASQHGSSLQVQGITDMTQWVLDQITMLKAHTDRPVIIRPHPRHALDLRRLPAGLRISKPQLVPNTYDSFDWSNQYHAVVNHNSGPGILAAISGVRPIVHDSSLAYPVAINISSIEEPYTVDREQWLTEISHTEYTLEELQQGTWLKRLSDWLK